MRKDLNYIVNLVFLLLKLPQRDDGDAMKSAVLKPCRLKAQVKLFPRADVSRKDRINERFWLQEVDKGEALSALPSFWISDSNENEYAIFDQCCDRLHYPVRYIVYCRS